MAWFPVSGTPLIALKANTSFGNNYVLKFYAAGTDNPIQCAFNRTATDPLGDPLVVDFIRFNEFGYSVNNSGGVCVPHVEVEYKAILYKNETDANNNDTNRAEYVVDYVRPGLIGFIEAGGQNNASLIAYQASATAVATDVQTALRRFISVSDFGAIGNGVNNDSNAIAAALSVENKDVIFHSGTYVVDGIDIVNDFQSCHFMGDVTLKASGVDVFIFHQQSSNSRHTGTFNADAAGHSGVYGLVVAPSDLTDNLSTEAQVYNILPGISDVKSSTGCAELVVIQPSPSPLGLNFGNDFPMIMSTKSTRGLWLKSPAVTGGLSSQKHSFGVVKCLAGNTGIHIDNGANNTFGQVSTINVDDGTSPNATPTSVYIANTCPVTGAKNENNDMPNINFSGNTRDVFLANNDNFIGGHPLSLSVTANQNFVQRMIWGQQDVLFGSVAASGTAVKMPSGWTVSRTSTGVYLVTHNLGDTNYVCIAMATSNNSNSFSVSIKTTVAIEFSGTSISGVQAQNADFDFIVIRY